MITLETAGQALYGPRWQSDIARDLNVNSRTVRRWIEQDSAPQGLEPKLLGLLKQRRELINQLIRSSSATRCGL